MATSELSSEEKKAYRKAFDHFDKNNDGTININELGDVMKNLGKNPSKEELRGKKINQSPFLYDLAEKFQGKKSF